MKRRMTKNWLYNGFGVLKSSDTQAVEGSLILSLFFGQSGRVLLSLWGGENDSCKRGIDLMEFILTNNLTVHNLKEQGPTFASIRRVDDRQIYGNSYIDLTMSNWREDDRWQIKDWRCDQDKFQLDHKLISFKFVGSQAERARERGLTTKRYNIDKAHWPLFLRTFERQQPKIEKREHTNEELERLSEKLLDAITRALDRSVPKLKSNSRSQPWFNEHLKKLKYEIDNTRKAIKKSQSENEKNRLMDELKLGNRHYKRECKKTKDAYYEKLNRINGTADLWKLLKKAKSIRGDSLKTFTKPDGQQTNDAKEIDRTLFDYFVPRNRACSETMKRKKIVKTSKLRPLADGELWQTIRFSLNKKAPGPDGIGNKATKLLFEHCESYFETYYNLLLNNVYLPKCLKRGQLIFFQKAGKSLDNVKGMRPITLLPVLGKVMESLLINRLNEKLAETKFFSPNQHGFTKQKSTQTAIEKVLNEVKNCKKRKTNFAVLIALDISSAFDKLNWMHVLRNLEKTGIDGCYLEAVRQLLIEREIKYDTGSETLSRMCEVGCPQGGRASPGLWLIGMNDMLTNLTRNRNSLKKLKKKFESAIGSIEEWRRSAGLKLSAENST